MISLLHIRSVPSYYLTFTLLLYSIYKDDPIEFFCSDRRTARKAPLVTRGGGGDLGNHQGLKKSPLSFYLSHDFGKLRTRYGFICHETPLAKEKSNNGIRYLSSHDHSGRTEVRNRLAH